MFDVCDDDSMVIQNSLVRRPNIGMTAWLFMGELGACHLMLLVMLRVKVMERSDDLYMAGVPVLSSARLEYGPGRTRAESETWAL